MDLLHDLTCRCIETSCRLYIKDHLLKYVLRIIAVAEEAAIDAIEPLLPFPIQNRCH